MSFSIFRTVRDQRIEVTVQRVEGDPETGVGESIYIIESKTLEGQSFELTEQEEARIISSYIPDYGDPDLDFD